VRKISSNDLYYDPRKGIQTWLANVPYLYLLQIYLDQYFSIHDPTATSTGQNTSAVNSNTNSSSKPSSEMKDSSHQSRHRNKPFPSSLLTSDSDSSHGNNNPREFSSNRSYSLTVTNQEAAISKNRNFIFRLIVGYWIDSVTVIHSDHESVHQWRRVSRNVANNAQQNPFGNANSFGYNDNTNYNEYDAARSAERAHPSPFDLLVFDPMAFKWTIPTCQVSKEKGLSHSFLFVFFIFFSRVCFCFCFICKKAMRELIRN
jgi:hypothetical protein